MPVTHKTQYQTQFIIIIIIIHNSNITIQTIAQGALGKKQDKIIDKMKTRAEMRLYNTKIYTDKANC